MTPKYWNYANYLPSLTQNNPKNTFRINPDDTYTQLYRYLDHICQNLGV